MEVKKFEDLKVWNKAKDFSVLIYKITEKENIKKDYGLKDQMRRASVSIVSNIAEGFERNGNKEFLHFLSLAKGSAGELRAQLHISKDLNYINVDEFKLLEEKVDHISRMISSFMNYIKKSELKGTKFVQDEHVIYDVDF